MDIESEILRAVRSGHSDRVRHIVGRHGLHESEGYPKGYYLLCEAIWHEKEDIARLLLDEGAQVSCVRKGPSYAFLPLHLACKRGSKDIARDCILKGADVNQKDGKQRTCLYYSYDESIVELLLNNGASTNIKDRCGHSPLHHVLTTKGLAQRTRERLFDAYVKYSTEDLITRDEISFFHDLLDIPYKDERIRDVIEMTELDPEQRTILDLFLAEIIRRLKSERAFWAGTLSGEGEPVINRVIKYGLIECCRVLDKTTLVVVNTEVNKEGLTCIDVATQQYLLEAKSWEEQNRLDGVDREWVPSDSVYYKMADIFIDKFIFDDFESPWALPLLHSAAGFGCVDFVKLIMRRGPEVDAFWEGLAPMHRAIKWYIDSSEFTASNRKTLFDIVNLLLIGYGREVDHRFINRRVKIDFSDKLGTKRFPLKDGTALHYAVVIACPNVVKVLLDNGADPNAVNSSGLTPFSLAIKVSSYRGEPEIDKSHDDYIKELKVRLRAIILMLLEYDADILAMLPGNKTAIQEAEDYCRGVIIKYIFKHDLHLDSKKDKFGNTLLHLACKFDRPGLFEGLLEKGSGINSSNDLGESPLHMACIHWDASKVVRLLDYGANAVSWTKHGLTPLEICWKNADESCIATLIARADSDGFGIKYQNVIDGIGKTALDQAFEDSSIIFTMNNFLDYRTNGVTDTLRPDIGLQQIRENQFLANVDVKKDIVEYLHNLVYKQAGPFFSESVQLAKTCIELINYYEQVDLKIDMPNVKCDTFLSVAIMECTLCVVNSPRSELANVSRYWLFEKSHFEPLPVIGVELASEVPQGIGLFEADLPGGIDARCYSPDELEFIQRKPESYRDACLLELERMKKTKLNKTKTLYDYLHEKNPSTFRQFWDSESKDKDLDRLLFLNDFPAYNNIIRAKIWRDSMRVELLPRAKSRILSYLMRGAPLRKVMMHNELATKILIGLSNFELMILIGLRASDVLSIESTGAHDV